MRLVSHWRIVYSTQAQKDAKLFARNGLKGRAQALDTATSAVARACSRR